MVLTDFSAVGGELGSNEGELAPINPRNSPAGREPGPCPNTGTTCPLFRRFPGDLSPIRFFFFLIKMQQSSHSRLPLQRSVKMNSMRLD